MRKRIVGSTSETDQDAQLTPAGDVYKYAIGPFGKLVGLDASCRDVAKSALLAGPSAGGEVVDA